MTDAPVETEEVVSIPTRYNEGLIGSLIQRSIEQPSSYPLSMIARIINRSSLGDYRTSPYVRKGEITSEDMYKEPGKVLVLQRVKRVGGEKVNLDHFIKTNVGTITYHEYTYPGWNHGNELWEALDRRFESLEIGEMPEEERFQAIAFVTASMVAIHAFTDGNKRTARGVAAFLVEKYTDRSLDMVKLRDRQDELATLLGGTGYRLLPDRYNPQSLLREMQEKGEAEREVVIPTPDNDLSPELPTFLKDFSDSIERFVGNAVLPFPETVPYSSPYSQLKVLAALYQESCKDKV